MIRISSILVEECADDSWLSFAHPLMPNAMARFQERQRLDEERRVEEECRVEVARRLAQRDADRVAREVAASRLSPTSSRTAARKTSNSSLGGGDVALESEESMGKRTRSVSRGRGRGQVRRGTRSQPVTMPTRSQVAEASFQEPKFVVPPNSVVVSNICDALLSLLITSIGPCSVHSMWRLSAKIPVLHHEGSEEMRQVLP